MKLNPSSRYEFDYKVCKRCRRKFICNQKWITKNNLHTWINKAGTNPKGKALKEEPLLCKDRKTCICDECRNPGGITCRTYYLD